MAPRPLNYPYRDCCWCLTAVSYSVKPTVLNSAHILFSSCAPKASPHIWSQASHYVRPQHDQKALKCLVFFRPQTMMNVTRALATLCVGHCTVCIPALHVVWCELPSPLPASLQNLHTNEHLNGLYDIIDLQLEIFLSWSLCTGWTKCAKWGTAHTHTHTHRGGEKWLLFCILMRVISCLFAMADKGTYLCPGPRCLTGGKCPLQRPALIVSEHVVRPIIIIIMGNYARFKKTTWLTLRVAYYDNSM